jgi:hypothetical protein
MADIRHASEISDRRCFMCSSKQATLEKVLHSRRTFCVSHSRGESGGTNANQMTTNETRNQSKTVTAAAVGSTQLVEPSRCAAGLAAA